MFKVESRRGADSPIHRKADHQTHTDPRNPHSNSLSHEHVHHFLPVCAKRHANANLTRALTHRVSHKTVEPDHSEYQGHGRQPGYRIRYQLRCLHRAIDIEIPHAARIKSRHVWIDTLNHFLKQWTEPVHVGGFRPGNQGHLALLILRERQIDKVKGSLRDKNVFGRFGDSNYLDCLAARIPQVEMLTERTFVG